MSKRRWAGRCKVIVSALVLGAVVVAVLLAAYWNPAFREGSSADFWYATCDVNLDGKQRHSMSAYPARDGWLLYRPSSFCGSVPSYRVREEEAFRDFPAVVPLLDENSPTLQMCASAIPRWQAKDPDGSQPRLFLQELRSARLDWLKQRQNGSHLRYLEIERSVAEYWWLAHNWRPVLVILEITYFLALAVFLLFPWWRSARWVWYAVHLAWFPWLILFPHWLGYAPLSFCSLANSDEGILYPSLLRSLPPLIEKGKADSYLMRQFPRPLLSWSVPGAPFPGFTFPLRDGYGPASAFAWGITLAMFPLIGWGVSSKIRKYRRDWGYDVNSVDGEDRAELKWWMSSNRGHES